MWDGKRVSVILMTYAERGSIRATIDGFFATGVVDDLRRLTDEAAEHVAEHTGLHPQVAYPAVRVVDRRDWAEVNIAGLREVITPLVGRLIA